jgi:hypothetical protein
MTDTHHCAQLLVEMGVSQTFSFSLFAEAGLKL